MIILDFSITQVAFAGTSLKTTSTYLSIATYFNRGNNSLKYHCQRFSYNSAQICTNEEVITVYLFCGCYQRYFSIIILDNS